MCLFQFFGSSYKSIGHSPWLFEKTTLKMLQSAKVAYWLVEVFTFKVEQMAKIFHWLVEKVALKVL